MLTRIGDMRSREVISVRDGARLGYLGDIEIDTESASLAAIVVYRRAGVLGRFGPAADCVHPGSDLTPIGASDALSVSISMSCTAARGFSACSATRPTASSRGATSRRSGRTRCWSTTQRRSARKSAASSRISLKTGEFSGRRPPFRGRFGPERRRRAEVRDKAQKNGEKGLI